MLSRLHPAALLSAFVALLFIPTLPLQAQSSAFTYQGQLTDGGKAAHGSYDFRFTVHDAATNGNVIAGPVTNAATLVSNGVFTSTLDFGGAAFNGAERWLELAVRTNTSSTAFQPLNPRQRITSTPYALRAAQFSGAVADSQLPNTVARLTSNQTFSGSVTFSNGSGSFSGNAAGLTNYNAANLVGAVPAGALTSVPAASLTGTVPDGRLSPNVAMLNRSPQFFNGNNSFFGSVGVNTSAGADALTVQGQIRLGPTTNLLASGGTERLRMVRGTLNGAGQPLEGTGFAASRIGIGYYHISFSSPFAGNPAVMITPIGTICDATVTSLNSTFVQLRFTNSTEDAVEPGSFTFFIVGTY